MRRNAGRIRVLRYFTGGSPRLVLMLYRIVASLEPVDAMRGLEKLLDEVTPYYKAKIEILPPQQRKILDNLARVSGKTHEGLTPTQLAEETRLPVNQVSSQLKRLSELGYVAAANVRSKNSYYSLAEPLYAIWHQMRFGRGNRQRWDWLVEFLRGWYSEGEGLAQCGRLAEAFKELVGDAARVGEALDVRQCFVDARAGTRSAFGVGAASDNLSLLQRVIKSTPAAEVLLPLARAIDYLVSRDRKIIEKLSAEVRPIVQEIVDDYEKKYPPKADVAPRRRARKTGAA
jgi:DNA-binding transcriptional ArsR family regulator